MKKLLAMFLALVMVLSLAACGKPADTKTEAPATNKTEAPAADKTDAATEAPTEAPKGDPVYINENAKELSGKITFYTAFADNLGTGALKEEFNKYYPNIEVETIVYKNNADGNIALDLAIQQGEVDVCLSFQMLNTFGRWENGLFMDITDRLAADNLDLKTEWGTDTYVYDGRVYSFPSGSLSYHIAINEDKWNAAGLGEVPTEWTWDEYLEACRKLTERDADGNTVVYGTVDYSDMESWTMRVKQVKGKDQFYNEDGTASDFDSELWAKAIQLEIDAVNEGIWLSKPTMTSEMQLRNRDVFLNGTVATSIDTILTRYLRGYIDHDFKTIYAPYPVWEKGQTNYMLGPVPNSFVGIASNTDNPEAAYAFAKFCATYGNKYMYASGHAGTWTGNNGDEILEVVFGSLEEAEKWVDPWGFNEYVVSAGKPSYSDTTIAGYFEITADLNELTALTLSGEMTVEEMMEELKEAADEYIADALDN